MIESVFGWTVLGLIVLVGLTFVWQWTWGHWEEVKVWNKLAGARSLPQGFAEGPGARREAIGVRLPTDTTTLELPHGTAVTGPNGDTYELPCAGIVSVPAGLPVNLPHGSVVSAPGITWQAEPRRWGHLSPAQAPRPRTRPKGALRAFNWALEREHWGKEAERIRQSFLARTQATAERWRNIFAALLAVFGAVLFVKPSLPPGEPMDDWLYVLVIVALVTAAQAVAYTGWASAGLPKMLVDVTPATAFYEQTSHAARSLIRLRVGLSMGGASAVALILAVARFLSSGM
jgi:hypothetical protein